MASQTISASGGTVTVYSPGSEIDGMTITVPPGSYPGSRTFTITTANITADNLGSDFHPITPVIQIDNGGGYADSVMVVTLPIELPDGHFAMAFYYDEVTGSLEGLPLLELTPTSITFATRHFMPALDLHFDESITKGSPLSFNASSNLLVSSISDSLLMGKSIISTGFKPGTDDYEFTNKGSYILPGGHCAGQSWTMMWYYYEKKLNGSPALYSQYDVLDNCWQDNPLYYRFASVVQNDCEVGLVFRTLAMMMNNQEYHHISWKAFAMSMLLTGHPQYVLLERADGRHAILAHKISMTDGILYVTDPNYPGQERQIKFENNKFSPYNTMQNANENDPTPYTGIGYEAVTAIIEWDKITQRYAQVLDSTIGNVAPNTFPAYTIWVKGETKQELENNFISEKDTFRCYVECPTAEVSFTVDGKKRITHQMFDGNGKMIAVYEDNAENYTLLKPGINKIGFYVIGWKNGYLESSEKHQPLFIDFKWFDVYYSTLKIDPDPIMGDPKEQIEIKVINEGTTPENVSYVWNFGDDTKEVTVKNNNTVKHSFANAGSYDVSVSMYDNKTNTLAGFAQAEAQIGSAGYVNLDIGIYGKAISYSLYNDYESSDINENYHQVLSYHGLKLSQKGNVYTANIADDPMEGKSRTGSLTVEVVNKVVKNIRVEEKILYYENNDTITINIAFDGVSPFKNDKWYESDNDGIKIYQWSASNTKIFDHFSYAYRKEGYDWKGRLELWTVDMNELNTSRGTVILGFTSESLY